jgi:hypothetical protein
MDGGLWSFLVQVGSSTLWKEMTTVSVVMLQEELWEPTLIQVWSLAALALPSWEATANECGFRNNSQRILYHKILNLSKWRLRSHVTLRRTLSYFTHILGKSNFYYREKGKKPQMDECPKPIHLSPMTHRLQPDLRQGRIHALMSILPPDLTQAGCLRLEARPQEWLPDRVHPLLPRGLCGY